MKDTKLDQKNSGAYTSYKYPNPLSDDTPATFDAYELRLVGEFEDEKGELFVEPVFNTDPAPKRMFWTIFGHTIDEGLTSLIDVDTEQEGMKVLMQMGVIT